VTARCSEPPVPVRAGRRYAPQNSDGHSLGRGDGVAGDDEPGAHTSVAAAAAAAATRHSAAAPPPRRPLRRTRRRRRRRGGGRHVGRGGQPVVGRLRRRGEDGRGGGGGCAIGAVGEEQRRVGRCRTAPFVKRLAALSLMCPVCVGRFATPCLQLASASRGAFLIGQRLFLIIIETSLIGQFRCRTSFFAGRCARVGRARACLAAAARD